MDLKVGVIRLRPEDTKTQEGRVIPLTKELSEAVNNATIYLNAARHRVPYVFTNAGKRLGSVRRAFETACRQAILTDVVFHDLRQAIAQMDTYMDTSAASVESSPHKSLKTHSAPVAQADRARDS
jgi:hypothetical protein